MMLLSTAVLWIVGGEIHRYSIFEGTLGCGYGSGTGTMDHRDVRVPLPRAVMFCNEKRSGAIWIHGSSDETRQFRYVRRAAVRRVKRRGSLYSAYQNRLPDTTRVHIDTRQRASIVVHPLLHAPGSLSRTMPDLYHALSITSENLST